jgi:hypothetical protein
VLVDPAEELGEIVAEELHLAGEGVALGGAHPGKPAGGVRRRAGEVVLDLRRLALDAVAELAEAGEALGDQLAIGLRLGLLGRRVGLLGRRVGLRGGVGSRVGAGLGSGRRRGGGRFRGSGVGGRQLLGRRGAGGGFIIAVVGARILGLLERLLRADGVGGEERADVVLQLLELRADELERLDERLVEGDRRVGGDAEDVDLEALELVGERGLHLQQPGPVGLDALAELIDLVEAHQAPFEIGVEQRQGALLGGDVLLGVADLLAQLEETEEAADVAGAAAGKPRAAGAAAADLEADALAAEEHAAEVAEAADAGAREAGESGAAEESAAALELLRGGPTERHLEEEPLAVELQRPQVGQQRPLDDRQRLQGDRPAGALEQRLDEVEVDQRDVVVSVGAGELPHHRVEQANGERAGGGKVFPRPEERIGRPHRRRPGGVERAAVGVGGGVAAEQLDVEPEALGADVECGEIQRLELVLPVERVEVRQADRRRQVEADRAGGGDLGELTDPLAPVAVLEIGPVAVGVPARPARLAVDAVHVAVRRRVVRRHRWEDLAVFVVEPAARIHPHGVVEGVVPARVARLLRQQRAHLAVGLEVVAAPRAAGRPGNGDGHRQEEAQGEEARQRHRVCIQAPLETPGVGRPEAPARTHAGKIDRPGIAALAILPTGKTGQALPLGGPGRKNRHTRLTRHDRFDR